jgi:hypothetical protein
LPRYEEAFHFGMVSNWEHDWMMGGMRECPVWTSFCGKQGQILALVHAQNAHPVNPFHPKASPFA